MEQPQDDWRPPPFSDDALRLMHLLMRRGSTMRLAPLRDAAGISDALLADTINELFDRCWVDIVWRSSPEHRDDDESRPLHDIRRIVATRFGKWRYRVTWQA